MSPLQAVETAPNQHFRKTLCYSIANPLNTWAKIVCPQTNLQRYELGQGDFYLTLQTTTEVPLMQENAKKLV